MNNITQIVAFVKSQIEFHLRQASKYAAGIANNPTYKSRAEAHKGWAAKFQEVYDYLTKTPAPTVSTPPRRRLGLTPAELEGLPAELLEELSISDSDKADFAVMSVIDDAGGAASMDQILVGLFRKNKEIHKRLQLNSRVYRMSQKGLIFPVPGKKGVYSTKEMTEEEANSLS